MPCDDSCGGHSPSGSWTKVSFFEIKINIKLDNLYKGER